MQTKFAVIRQQSSFMGSIVSAKAGRTGSTNRAGRLGKEKPWLTCHEKNIGKRIAGPILHIGWVGNIPQRES